MLRLFMKKLVKLIFFVSIVSLSINLPTYANVKDSLGKITEKFKPKIFQTSGSKEFETISKYSLKDILDYQESHLKSGVLSYRFKEYNFWTIKDNLSLDGKERKVITITLNDGQKIKESYFIEYYQDGTIEFKKNSDPENSSKDQWIISIHPDNVNWYSERQYYWKKVGEKKQLIGRWKARSDNKWIYGIVEPDVQDPSIEKWLVYGVSKNDLQSQTGLSQKEQKKLFKIAKKESSEANEIFEFLSKLQKNYFSKIKKDKNSFLASKDNNKSSSSIEDKLKSTHGADSTDNQRQEELLKKLQKEKNLIAKEKAEVELLLKKLEDKQRQINNIDLIRTDEKYFALIIGNNNYEYLERLDAAQKDAEVISEILENKYGFEVKLLLNADYETTVDTLYEVTNKLKKNENLLIYYAGHGEIEKAENRGYWLPVDASYEKKSKWISNQRIVDRIKATKAKHVLLIADSCFSGTLMRSGSNLNSTEPIDEKYIQRLKNKKTRLVITSGGNEPVVDNAGGLHSLFALKLIETLKSNNNVINSQILFENIRRYVVSNADQTPERAQVHKAGHDGGDFLFFPK